MLIFC